MLRLLALCALLAPMADTAIPLYPETGDLIGADRAPAAADRGGSFR
ncbi:hypothetical protein SAMN05421763_106154 [[Luteovulum] sphaeroides subsp. megalophilum]|nr:hypothetical protein [Cereibacter sphaeroides]SNT21874.1 hypothetical protein SAMN05421763_106154 [[Luteovulum] sphaeroides subsp. megalophilum]